ncbi:CBS domain-containing protein [Halomarina halobia]|uniref:CBS domain-containing protein n=1 Tax=Halomarina halobia TaxID=3033386 RepID=A0ABD6ACW7_9EURY|nr:CBS domain-containing protein [Halomarina sp. PSR21]
MAIGKLATRDVVTAERDATLIDLAKTMESEGVGAVVIAEDERPVGVVTDRDVALAVGRGEEPESCSADDLIGGEPFTIEEDTEGYDAIRQFGESRVRRAPIVDDQGTLTGIVTLDDVVATIGEELKFVADVIEEQSPDYSP